MQTKGWLNIHRPYIDTEKFVQLSDEELCKKVQQGGAASRGRLWRRYQDFVRRVVYKRSQQHHLPPHEMADALQESYFAFHEAVRQYNPRIVTNNKAKRKQVSI